MQSIGNLRRKFGLLLLAGSGVMVLVDCGREFTSVDRCLDAGRVYDYRDARCREDVIHLPYVPYAERRPALLFGMGVLAILGLGLVVLDRRNK